MLVAFAQRALPDEETFFAAVRANLAAANQAQDRYAYKERRSDVHRNPFGRIGTGGVRVYEMRPAGEPGVWLRRLLEREGKPVADQEPERIQRRGRPQGRSAVEDTVSTLRFAIDRREVVNGRDVIMVRFEPRADAMPQTREGRLARVFKGTIWVDEAAREVMRVDATAIDDISYGFGVLARLHEGTVVTLTREPIDGDIWLPTSIRFKGEGRAVLVRKLNVDYAVEWFDYTNVSTPNSQPPIPKP
jgi:hypothetical protein